MIEDVKRTQADINLLEGKLYRTYVEADSRIFEFAKEDPQMIAAYKVNFNDYRINLWIPGIIWCIAYVYISYFIFQFPYVAKGSIKFSFK